MRLVWFCMLTEPVAHGPDFFMATNSIQGVTLERVRITGRPKMISIPANAAPEYCPVYEFQVPAKYSRSKHESSYEQLIC